MKKIIIFLLLLSSYSFGQRMGCAYGLNRQMRAYDNACATPPVSAVNYGLNNFVHCEIGNGDWSNLDRVYVFAQDQQANSKIDLVAQATLTEVSSPTWTQYQGYTGNGTSSCLNTGFNPSIGGFNYSDVTATSGAYSRASLGVATGHCLFGVISNAFHVNSLQQNYTGLGTLWNSNESNGTGNAQVYSGTVTTGMQSLSNTSSNEYYYEGGIQKATASGAFAAPNGNIYLLAQNNNITGTPTARFFSTNQIAFFYAGGNSVSQANIYRNEEILRSRLGY